MSLALLGLLQCAGGVLRREATADGAGVLRPEIEREVLLVLVEEAELSTLLGVDDGQDTSDRLSEIVAIAGKKTRSAHCIPPCPARTSSSSSARGFPEENIHLVELGARRNDLLDAKLAELSLQLTKLLGEIVLVLGP